MFRTSLSGHSPVPDTGPIRRSFDSGCFVCMFPRIEGASQLKLDSLPKDCYLTDEEL